jgi:hypothetical protein
MTFTARATGRFPVQEHQARSGSGHTHGAPIGMCNLCVRGSGRRPRLWPTL